jgi:SAM-dependent methyltransferase
MPSREFVAPPGQSSAQHRMEKADRYNAWLLDRGRPYLGERVLDVGAGLGPFVALLPATASVLALEPDAEFADELRRRFSDRPNVRVAAIGVEGLADDESLGPFDTIVCFNVLEHLPDDLAALRILRARLVPGGCLLVVVPAHERLFGMIDREVGHERRYGRDVLRTRLEAAAFDVLDIRYVNPVGALGWLVTSVLLRRPAVPAGPLAAYDRFVPLFRALDRLCLPFGLSVWAVGLRAPQLH